MTTELTAPKYKSMALNGIPCPKTKSSINLDDLDIKPENEGKLMYPEISSYEMKSMDDFIESFHSLFEQHAKNQ